MQAREIGSETHRDRCSRNLGTSPPPPQAVIKGRNQGSRAKWKYSVSTLASRSPALDLDQVTERSVSFLFVCEMEIACCIVWLWK